MKRLKILIGLIIMVSLFLILPACNKSSQTHSVLSIVTGNVTVLKPGTVIWIEGQVGMNLDVDYTIKTDADARATITFYEGSIIELEGSTEIQLMNLGSANAKTTDVIIRQELGKSISRVKKVIDPASRYEIKTPVAVAGVRGSIMFVAVAEDGTTVVGNEEGSVSVTAQGVETIIPINTHSVILPNQAPGIPEPGIRAFFFDLTGDLFDSESSSISGENYLDIIKSQLYYSNGQYIARIELNGMLPNELGDNTALIEWDILVDFDSKASTGFNWSLVANDIGYDYMVPLSLQNTGYELTVPLSNASGLSITFNVKDNVIEMYFPPEAVGSASSFDWIVVARKYKAEDPPNAPSIIDKAPNEGHYSFP